MNMFLGRMRAKPSLNLHALFHKADYDSLLLGCGKPKKGEIAFISRGWRVEHDYTFSRWQDFPIWGTQIERFVMSSLNLTVNAQS